VPSKVRPFGLLPLLCLSLLAGCRSGGEAREVDLLIVGGTVIDPASRSVVRNAAVAIDEGAIVAAGQFDPQTLVLRARNASSSAGTVCSPSSIGPTCSSSTAIRWPTSRIPGVSRR
jgi:hypothetical protein